MISFIFGVYIGGCIAVFTSADEDSRKNEEWTLLEFVVNVALWPVGFTMYWFNILKK